MFILFYFIFQQNYALEYVQYSTCFFFEVRNTGWPTERLVDPPAATHILTAKAALSSPMTCDDDARRIWVADLNMPLRPKDMTESCCIRGMYVLWDERRGNGTMGGVSTMAVEATKSHPSFCSEGLSPNPVGSRVPDNERNHLFHGHL